MRFSRRDIGGPEIAIDPSRERLGIEAEVRSLGRGARTRPAEQPVDGAIAIRVCGAHKSIPII